MKSSLASGQLFWLRRGESDLFSNHPERKGRESPEKLCLDVVADRLLLPPVEDVSRSRYFCHKSFLDISGAPHVGVACGEEVKKYPRLGESP